MFQVELTAKAKKELRRLDKRYQLKSQQAIDMLESDPFLGEKMKGDYQGCYRVKIPPMRIIYSIDQKNKVISVISIGHRQGIYK